MDSSAQPSTDPATQPPTAQEPYSPGDLRPDEKFWRHSWEWLKDRGYQLPPWYAHDWTPSWKISGLPKWQQSDFLRPVKHGVTEATQISDGTEVYLKVVDEENGKIARTLSPIGLEKASCSVNHCVPVLEVLSIPDWKGKVILVMPRLQEFDEPLFSTVGEALECIRQLIEGLQYMHRLHIAHGDVNAANVMMSPSAQARHGLLGRIRPDWRSRTETHSPVRYYFIGFRYSEHFNEGVLCPCARTAGADSRMEMEAPEVTQDDGQYDPFPLDVYYLGYLINKYIIEPKHGLDILEPLIYDMTKQIPSERLNIEEVAERFEERINSLTEPDLERCLKKRARSQGSEGGQEDNQVSQSPPFAAHMIATTM